LPRATGTSRRRARRRTSTRPGPSAGTNEPRQPETDASDNPEIVALHSVLRVGRETGYDAAHQRIPDELIEAHRRAGICDWRIWRSGRNLFHVVECDDFDAALRALAQDPANERWQAFIGDYVERFDGTPLPEVWRMRDQIGSDTG
jgi:L-rhamnose mutarotase